MYLLQLHNMMCLTFSLFFCPYICGADMHTNLVQTGAYDDPNGSHISIEVTSSLFEGKRPVQRQQLVYKALWEGMCEIYFVCTLLTLVCSVY